MVLEQGGIPFDALYMQRVILLLLLSTTAAYSGYESGCSHWAWILDTITRLPGLMLQLLSRTASVLSCLVLTHTATTSQSRPGEQKYHSYEDRPKTRRRRISA